MIAVKVQPRTSQYGSHMGTCYHYPAIAEAWDTRFPNSRVFVTSDEHPGLSDDALGEKAIAILRHRFRRMAA